jgi:hypothetical protein
MNKWIAKLSMVFVAGVVALGMAAAPAKADEGGPMVAEDGRKSPSTADRIAVYCYEDGIEVWGIDGNLNGSYLTIFTPDELLSGLSASHTAERGGVVSLSVTTTIETWEVTEDDGTVTTEDRTFPAYLISWTGGEFGADGGAAFTKVVACSYVQSEDEDE